MKEVELKARLTNKEETEQKLCELGAVFSAPISQEDVVYVREVGSIETFLSNHAFLRIREQHDRVFFTLKYHTDGRRGDDPTSMPVEHELEVSDKPTMQAILSVLGFHEAVAIRKTRKKTNIGSYEVCLDEVEGLGTFIEVEELIAEDGDTLPVLARMKEFLLSVGVRQEDIGVKRYDLALLEKESTGI